MKVYEVNWRNDYLNEMGTLGIFSTAPEALAAITTPKILDNKADDTEFSIVSWELGKSDSCNDVMAPTELGELKQLNVCIAFPKEKEEKEEEKKTLVCFTNPKSNESWKVKLSKPALEFLIRLEGKEVFLWDEVEIKINPSEEIEEF